VYEYAIISTVYNPVSIISSALQTKLRFEVVILAKISYISLFITIISPPNILNISFLSWIFSTIMLFIKSFPIAGPNSTGMFFLKAVIRF